LSPLFSRACSPPCRRRRASHPPRHFFFSEEGRVPAPILPSPRPLPSSVFPNPFQRPFTRSGPVFAHLEMPFRFFFFFGFAGFPPYDFFLPPQLQEKSSRAPFLTRYFCPPPVGLSRPGGFGREGPFFSATRITFLFSLPRDSRLGCVCQKFARLF